MFTRKNRTNARFIVLAIMIGFTGCSNTPGGGLFGGFKRAKAARDPDPNRYVYGQKPRDAVYSPTSNDPAAFRPAETGIDENNESAAPSESPPNAVDDYVARLNKATSNTNDAAIEDGNVDRRQEGIPWQNNNTAKARPLDRNRSDENPIAYRPQPQEQAMPYEAPQRNEPVVKRPPAVESVGVRGGQSVSRTVSQGRDNHQPIARTASSNVRAQQGMDLNDLASSRDLQQLIDAAKIAVVSDPSNPRKQLRLSLLQLANDQPEEAARLSPAIDHRERELISQFVTSIGKVDRRFSDPLLDTDAVLASIDDLRDSIRDTAELTIPAVALCSRVQTFGIYDEIPASHLRAHQVNRVIVYCEVDHFKSRIDDSTNQFRTELGSHLELFTADGRSIWSQTEDQIIDLSRQQREDFFLAQLVSFPGNISAGEYVLKIAITDAQAQKTTEAVHRFEVR